MRKRSCKWARRWVRRVRAEEERLASRSRSRNAKRRRGRPEREWVPKPHNIAQVRRLGWVQGEGVRQVISETVAKDRSGQSH
jgi:hypothetical protein